MLILPYSTALRLNQIPYTTFTIMLLCIAIFFFQLQNREDIDNSIEQYCVSTLYYMHQSYDIKNWKEYYLTNYIPDDKDDDLLKYIPYDLNNYQNLLLDGIPRNLDVNLMYYPFTFNPFKMLTSALSHADWLHIIFNLIFFFAFTPVIEILIANKLKFIVVLVTIELVGGILFSVSGLISGSIIPTLGLSGSVMGMIGFSAYMMPKASIRTIVWFLFFIKRIFIPVWILAVWYIGWDIYYVISSTENGGVNFLAHVSGGITGYLIARFWFWDRREIIQDELMDEIEHARASRQDSGSMMSMYMGDRIRIDSDHRESQANKNWGRYKDQLYKMVMSGNSSDAMVFVLNDYDDNSKSPETYEELFYEFGKWRKKRSYYCIARLLINLYQEQGSFGKAFIVLNECYKTDADFILPDSSSVLTIATEAVNQMQYELAYTIIRDYKKRYNINQTCIEQIILEARILWQNLNQQENAIALLKKEINGVGIYEAEKLQHMLNVIVNS